MKSSPTRYSVIVVLVLTLTATAFARQTTSAPPTPATTPPVSTTPATPVAAPIDQTNPANPATETPKHPAKKKASASHGASFKGEIASVDAKEMSVNLTGKKEKTLYVDSKSHLEKDGKPAVFADLKAREQLYGTSRKEKDGKLTIVHASIGMKPATAEAKKSNKTPPAQ